MKKNTKIIILSIILQIVISYNIGVMTEAAITYSAQRGAMLLAAFVMILCVLGKLYIDTKILLEPYRIGASKLVFDVVVNMSGAILSIIIIELYANSIISLTLAAMFISFILTVIIQKGIYVKCNPIDAIEYSEIEIEERESDEIFDKNNRKTKSTHIFIVQALRVASEIMLMVFCMIVMGDLFAQKYNGLYYLLIVVSAIIAAGVDNAYVSFGEIYADEMTTNGKRIGFVVISLLISLFLCQRSILIGLVFLLEAFVILVIIPILFDNWGRGGTNVVNQNKELYSRLASRIFFAIIITLAVWLLSYGAIWEIDYLVIISAVLAAVRYMSFMNKYIEAKAENDDDPYDIESMVDKIKINQDSEDMNNV